MQKPKLNMSAFFCALFFLFMPIFPISISTSQSFPQNMIAGSIYEAKFYFYSNLDGNYMIYANISDVLGNETTLKDCTENEPGQFVCERNLANGLNSAILYLNFSPYSAPQSHSISIVFAIPYENGIIETSAITSSYGGGVQYEYLMPPPPKNEEPILHPTPPPAEKKPENKTNQTIKNYTEIFENKTYMDNSPFLAPLLNNTVKKQENKIFGFKDTDVYISSVMAIGIIGAIACFILKKKISEPKQIIEEVV